MRIEQRKTYRNPTGKEKSVYYGTATLLWASNVPEILYMLFTKNSARDGVQAAFQKIFNQHVSVGASQGIAWILAALDFIINLCLFDPNGDALGVSGLEKDPDGRLRKLIIEEAQALKNEISANPEGYVFKTYKFIFTRFLPYLGMILNFPTGALADYLPVQKKDWLKGNLAAEIAVASLLVVLGVTYYLALTFNDVIESADSLFLDFGNSDVAKLFRHSKAQGLDATLTSATTHIFRSSTFAYIMYLTMTKVLKQNPGSILTHVMTGLGFYGGFEMSLLSRTMPTFRWLLGRVEDKDKKTVVYQKALLAGEDLSSELQKIGTTMNLLLRLMGVGIGSIRASTIGWLINFYAGDALENTSLSPAGKIISSLLIAGVPAVILFYHAYCVHVTDMQYVYILKLREMDNPHANKKSISTSSKVIAFITNLASQLARSFITIAAIDTLLAKQVDPADGFLNCMDPQAANVLGGFLGLEVAVANYWFFNEKAQNIIELRKGQLTHCLYGKPSSLAQQEQWQPLLEEGQGSQNPADLESGIHFGNVEEVTPESTTSAASPSQH